jgi:hyperosmotically inducible protein
MLRKLAALVASAGLVMTVACAKTDAGITTNVKSKLAADDTVKAYQINVDTSNGVVTLTGTVENPAAKEQAVVIARQTDGVTNVVDQITVNRAEATSGENIADRTADASRNAVDRTEDYAKKTGNEAGNLAKEAGNKTENFAKEAGNKTEDLAKKTGEAVTDGAITSAVKTKMLADSTVKGLKIDVDTNNGVVTLNGNVSSNAEADKAIMIARDTKGVSRVVSNLHVK